MTKRYNSIIIITVYPMSERDAMRHGVYTFLDKGYSVKVLAICPLFTSNYVDIVVSNENRYAGCKLIQDADELILELDKLASENCLIIFHCSIVYHALRLYRIIKRYSIDYANVNIETLTCTGHHTDNICRVIYSKIIRYIKLISVRAICDKILSCMPSKYYWIFGIAPTKYYLIGGMHALESNLNFYFTNNTTVIYAHSMDYDHYLEMDASKSTNLEILRKYCVFIDDYLPYHPDFTIMGEMPPCSETNYYPALNRFFDYVEKKFNLKVIIAAHPRAKYILHPNAFPSRTIISGKTNYLVRDAEFVIMHASAALSYSILFKKPILFITTNEIKVNSIIINDQISLFAKHFGQKPINIDENYSSLCSIPDIDEYIYEKFINDYIKIKNTPEKKIWEIFIDEIEKD